MRIVLKYIFLVVVLSGIIFSPILLYHKFQINTLVIVSNKSQLNGLALLNRNNLLLINEKYIIDNLQKQNPEVKSIHMIKILPQTIILQVEARVPVAQVVTSSEKIYVDGEGMIISQENIYPNLPKIQIPDMSISPNKRADWRTVKASSFIQEAKKQGIIIEQIVANDATSVFTAKTLMGTEILLPYDTDIALKVSSLQVIVQRFKIVGKNITKIDFRFDKPLVTLSNGEKISSSLPIQ